MEFSIENGFFYSGPLPGRRKTRPEIEIFNREWNFQTENENFKREWKFCAWGNVFFLFTRSSENEFFRSPGPLGIDDTDQIQKYQPRKPHGLAKPSRILSKREADAEFQYRPHIIATDRIADAVLADAVAETSNLIKRDSPTDFCGGAGRNFHAKVDTLPCFLGLSWRAYCGPMLPLASPHQHLSFKVTRRLKPLLSE